MNHLLYNHLRKLTAASTIKVVLTPRRLDKVVDQMIIIQSDKNLESKPLTVTRTKIRKQPNSEHYHVYK